jgi:membrane-bound ClpP family serine protease
MSDWETVGFVIFLCIVGIAFAFSEGGLLLVGALLSLVESKDRRKRRKSDDADGSSEGEKVGRQGEAASDLRPSGYVTIDGEKFSAISDFGYVTRGTKIEVTGDTGGELRVKAVEG